jgi:hypothetical protein
MLLEYGLSMSKYESSTKGFVAPEAQSPTVRAVASTRTPVWLKPNGVCRAARWCPDTVLAASRHANTDRKGNEKMKSEKETSPNLIFYFNPRLSGMFFHFRYFNPLSFSTTTPIFPMHFFHFPLPRDVVTFLSFYPRI